MLRSSAANGSSRPAIVDVGGHVTTYAELVAEVDAIAAAVRAAGVTPDRSVAVVLPNGPAMAAAFLGVSEAAICAPLNPAYTESELAFFYEDLDVAALVTDGCCEPAVALARRRNVPIITGPFAPAPPCEPRAPDDVALVLHTSGTTARPKQVPLSHANLVTSAINVANTLGLEPGDRGLNVMPLFHIHGIVAALLASLRAGASVICTPGFDGPRFLATAADQSATWYTAVPTMHQAVLAAARRDPHAVARCRFRFIRSSSAALPPQVLRDLEATFDAPVIEAYGMTEASHQMASNPLPPATRKPGTVGVAAGAEIAIMGAGGEMLAPGSTGEIVIRGPAVTRGYVADADVNAAAFAHGWFHTGDEGVLDDDGYLTITGRLKEMINRAGEKVSPREVEEVLLSHPDVAQAVVFAVAHPTMGEDVGAAVVPSTGVDLDVDDLRWFASVQLSRHKVPQRIVVRSELPLGATGKLQRIGMAERLGLLADAAPAPAAAPTPTPADPGGVVSPVEAAVAAVWAGALGLDRVGLDDVFVELGGDSLSAVALTAQLVDTFDVDLPVTAPLAEARTVRAMAALITESRARPETRRETVGAGTEIPDGVLTLEQEGMWFLEALEPNSSALHVPMALRLRGPIDVGALERSLNDVIARHETLRTRFVSDAAARPRSVVDANLTIELVVEDRPGVAEADRVATARDIVEADARERFDVTAGPLLRARLVRFADDDWVLGIVIHHLAADGWSRGTIRTELAALYRAAIAGTEPALAPVPGRFAEFAWRERQRISNGALDRQLAYWTRVLTPLPPPVVLPADRRGPLADAASAEVRTELPAATVTALAGLAREHDATLFMALLAGYVATLHRHTGSTDIVVGVPVAGRTDLRSQGVVGSFVNVLPVRVAVEPDLPFVELLERVRTTCLDGYANQAAPLDWLIQQLRPERSLLHRPLVQVAFQLRNLPSSDMAMGSVRVDDIEVHSGATQYDLAVDAVERDGAIGLTFDYPTARFDHDTIEYCAGHFVELLTSATRDPGASVGSLPMLTAAEAATVRAFGTGPPQPPPATPVHELIAAVAAAAPDAVAVQMADDLDVALTYAELDRRANRLAQHLVRSGVGPGQTVALCVPRTLDLVVAILGVLKAGAAFVPLDATHPPDRIAAVLDDANASALLTADALAHRFSESIARVFVIEREQPAIDRMPPDPPLVASAMHDLAYVQFTSGSTGRPKGVEVEHRSLAAYVNAFQREIQLAPSSATLAATSLTFDAFIDELLSPLVIGARVVLANDLTRLDAAALVRVLDAGAADVVMGTPTFVAHLLDAGWTPGAVTAVLGGETLTPALAARLLEHCREVWNAYGPTETTDAVTAYHVTRADVTAGAVPIGRPIAGQVLRVIEPSGQLAGVGVEGELYIGGLGVARGYRNQPDLTSAAFVDVATDEGPQRMYRSGDRCRWRADGALEYVGRADDQVKVRGVRIELGDVEAALSAHPAVTTAVADVRDGRLVAWVTAGDLSVDALLQFASATLPRSMMPSAVAIVDQVPMSSAGKVDRAALVDPPAVVSDEGTPPQGDLEITMANVWSGFLPLAGGVHRESDFFLLGGDSLMTVQLIAEIERRFLCALPLQQVLESSTLAGMTAAVVRVRDRGASAAPRTDPLVPLRVGRGTNALFWVPGAGGSPISSRWIADAVDDGTDVYCFEAAHHRGVDDPSSIVDMAAGYVEALLARQPARFVVGGASFGAIVAHEMACQLADLGRAPGALVFLDPQFTTPGRVRKLAWRIERVVRDGRTKRPPPGERRLPWPPAFKHVVAVSAALRASHEPRRYPYGVVVIASREDRVHHGRSLGLRPLVAGQRRIVGVRGGHHTQMTGERLSVAGRTLRTALSELSDEGVG